MAANTERARNRRMRATMWVAAERALTDPQFAHQWPLVPQVLCGGVPVDDDDARVQARYVRRARRMARRRMSADEFAAFEKDLAEAAAKNGSLPVLAALVARTR